MPGLVWCPWEHLITLFQTLRRFISPEIAKLLHSPLSCPYHLHGHRHDDHHLHGHHDHDHHDHHHQCPQESEPVTSWTGHGWETESSVIFTPGKSKSSKHH